MKTEVQPFDWLIAPISSEQFFAEYWEQKPVHIRRGNPEYYKDIITQADLDNLISNGDLRYPALRLVQKGNDTPRETPFYPAEAYTANWKHGTNVYAGMPDVDKIFAEYRAGASINLPGLEQFWRPLLDLCVAVEGCLNHAVRTNGYITSANSQAFALHYDSHDVFVMQIAGKKRWRVYEPLLPLPLVNQPFAAQPYARNFTPPSPPLMEPVLEQGDMLYLPRGYIHAATTMEGYSAHVTIGVTVYTWMNLLFDAFMPCMEREEFRRALPPGFANRTEMKEVMRETLGALISEYQQHIDYDRLIDNFMRQVTANKLRSKGTFHCDVSEAPE